MKKKKAQRKRDLAWLREKRRRERDKLNRLKYTRSGLFGVFGKKVKRPYKDLTDFQKEKYRYGEALLKYLTREIKRLEAGGFLEKPESGPFWWGRRYAVKEALADDPGRF